eukprot:scaffold131341_cov31-Tisochrysis_lutea.AAC.5
MQCICWKNKASPARDSSTACAKVRSNNVWSCKRCVRGVGSVGGGRRGVRGVRACASRGRPLTGMFEGRNFMRCLP